MQAVLCSSGARREMRHSSRRGWICPAPRHLRFIPLQMTRSWRHWEINVAGFWRPDGVRRFAEALRRQRVRWASKNRLSCLFADHLKRRLASSGRPPDERPNSTNDVTFAVVLSRLKLGPDKCPSDRSRCEPGPTGYFLWPGSASIGDIEYTAA